MTANNQSLLHQLTSDTSNTSVPRKPSTSVCSTRLSHQVSINPLHDHTDSIESIFKEECISEHDNSSFATPIEAIFIPDIKIEPYLDECEISLENLSENHDADMQPPIQIDNPASSSVPGTERLQHPQVPRQLTSDTSNTLLKGKVSFPDRSTIQFPTSSFASLSDMNLLQHLVKKYHIKDLTIKVSRLSDQVLESLQQNGTVNCNVVDNKVSEQRNVRIKLEPVTVDPCVCDDQVSDNLQQNLSSTVDDDDIEVPFEAINIPVVKCEPDLVKSEPSSDLSTAQFAEKRFNAQFENDDKKFQCDVCRKILSSKHTLTEHKMRIHTKISALSCDICSKICYTEWSLKAHTIQVHSNLSYKCDICGKSFKLKSHVSKHQQTVHASVRAFSCNQCDKTFVSKCHLKRHSFIHSDSRPFKCEKCGSCFSRSGDLTRHIVTVHSNVRAFKCHLCDKSYPSKCNLTRHLISHSDVRNYKCEQCGKLFKTKPELKIHLTSHSEIRPFACAQCHKKFRCNGQLLQHLRHAHSDLRPFSCDKCSYACKSKCKLKIHQHVHSNVRKFECCHCESKFKYKNHLSVHIKTKHSNL